jgi:glycosyltransferase involved in cell wall biosynthesis
LLNTKCDIICFSLSRWDAPISSPALSLAKEFAKTNRVFYVEHPYSWKDYFKLKHTPEIQQRKEALLQGKKVFSNPNGLPSKLTIVTPQLTFPINSLPAGQVYDRLAAINDKIILKVLRKLIREYDVRDYIYLNFFDPYFLQQLPSDFHPARTVYQSMDDISQVPYSRRHGLRLEEKIIRNFDYTLCTSKELVRLKSTFSPNVYFHPNAADISIFAKAVTDNLTRPSDLPAGNKKIIGFTGSIEYRSDFDLLKKIALKHADKVLFFVGPVNTDEHRTSGLDQLPNVVFAGPRKIEELPAYLRYFDVTIIPYRKTILTKSIYPLKINEYLAAGKPVVATHFSEDIYSFREVAYVTNTHDEFLAAIDVAINNDDPTAMAARLKVAASNTWTARVEQFWEIISREPATTEKGS